MKNIFGNTPQRRSFSLLAAQPGGEKREVMRMKNDFSYRVEREKAYSTVSVHARIGIGYGFGRAG